jgi:hypothetical protein
MSRSSLQREPDGVAASLLIYLFLCCAVAAFFALVMYYLMQPTRLPNPGMAALKSSPATVSYLELLRSEREAAQRAAKFKVEPETTGAVTREAPDVKPEEKKPKNMSQSHTRPKTDQRRTRPERQQEQRPDTHYAQQPSFSDYRPMY